MPSPIASRTAFNLVMVFALALLTISTGGWGFLVSGWGLGFLLLLAAAVQARGSTSILLTVALSLVALYLAYNWYIPAAKPHGWANRAVTFLILFGFALIVAFFAVMLSVVKWCEGRFRWPR